MVQGLGFWGLGFRVWGFGVLGIGVWGLGFEVLGFWGLGFWGLGFGVWADLSQSPPASQSSSTTADLSQSPPASQSSSTTADLSQSPPASVFREAKEEDEEVAKQDPYQVWDTHAKGEPTATEEEWHQSWHEPTATKEEWDHTWHAPTFTKEEWDQTWRGDGAKEEEMPPPPTELMDDIGLAFGSMHAKNALQAFTSVTPESLQRFTVSRLSAATGTGFT